MNFFYLFFALLSIITSQRFVDGRIWTGLDSKVWESNVTIYWDPTIQPGELPYSFAPFLCEFHHVFIDATSIFLRPKAGKANQAVMDLFDCCMSVPKGSYKQDCGDSSVHFGLCYCFHLTKYVPAIATTKQVKYLEKIKKDKNHKLRQQSSNDKTKSSGVDESYYLKGVTWLMHHWSLFHHPDHFNMKILEFRGLMANRDNPAVANVPHYNYLPKRVDRVVSLDYPVRNFTDYEEFIYEITEDTFKRKLDWFTLNPFDDMRQYFDNRAMLLMLQRLYSYCEATKPTKFEPKEKHDDSTFSFQKWFSSLGKSKPKKSKSEQSQQLSLAKFCEKEYNKTKVLPLPFWYAQTAYISPRYKNNVPYPYNITQQSFQKSVRNTLQRKLNMTTLTCFKPPGREKEYTVAILQRTEGAGLRRLKNLDEIARVARSVLKVSSIQEWYIDASMSAANQALYFHCFDVLISSHSSQLTNMIFSQPGSQVLEIQAEHVQEKTFLRLGEQVGVDYFFLNKGHEYHTNHYDNASWAYWDFVVNLDYLSEALKQAKINLERRTQSHALH